MLEHKKGKSPSWRQSLFLIVFGAAVGYSSFVNMDIWGASASRYQNLDRVGFFAGTVAFIAGFASFLTIAFKAVTSSPRSDSAIAGASGTSSKETSVRSPRNYPDVIPARQAGGASDAGLVLVVLLRIALVATIVLACIVLLRDWGLPPLTSSYGRSYWLKAFLSLLLSQLPFVVALIRTWKIPDHAGLALAIVAAAMQVVVNLPFFLTLMNLPGMRTSSSPLEIMLGVVVVAVACLAWRASASCEGDAGRVVSIFFGFLGYAVLWRIALGILFRP
jgi:heme/copper-type cytochrome/quinol oxidase subunit 4